MGSMLLTHTKHIQHLLNQAKIYNVNVVTTSVQNSYNSMVGALKYVTLIRPDITSSVNKLNHVNSWHILFQSQLFAVKRIMWYPSGTIIHGLLLAQLSLPHKLYLRAYPDSDQANDFDDRRSTSKSCIFSCLNLILWSSKKQPLVPRISTKIEYCAPIYTTSELLLGESFLNELVVPFLPPTFLCGNLNAVFLSHNLILYDRTKHIKLDVHFIRERVIANEMNIQHDFHLSLSCGGVIREQYKLGMFS